MDPVARRRFLGLRVGHEVCVAYGPRRTAGPVLGVAVLLALAGCASLSTPVTTEAGCPVPAAPVAETIPSGDANHIRVDFSIDPDPRNRFVGIVIVDDAYEHYDRVPDRLHYEPTDELWRDFANRVRRFFRD
jgi:hypothetical protein